MATWIGRWLRARARQGGSVHVHHIRTEEPMKVRVDGQSGRGVILPPEPPTQEGDPIA